MNTTALKEDILLVLILHDSGHGLDIAKVLMHLCRSVYSVHDSGHGSDIAKALMCLCKSVYSVLVRFMLYVPIY